MVAAKMKGELKIRKPAATTAATALSAIESAHTLYMPPYTNPNIMRLIMIA